MPKPVQWGYRSYTQPAPLTSQTNLSQIILEAATPTYTFPSFLIYTEDSDPPIRKWMLMGPLSTLPIVPHLRPDSLPGFKGDLVLEVYKEETILDAVDTFAKNPLLSFFAEAPSVFYKTFAWIRPAYFPDDYRPKDIKPRKQTKDALKIFGLKGGESGQYLVSFVVFRGGLCVRDLCAMWNRKPREYVNFTNREVGQNGEELVDGQPVWVPPPMYQ